MFFKGLKEAGDESKVRSFCGKLRISFFVGGDLAAKYTREGEGHADEGWFIDNDVVSKICTDFNNVLFETVGKSSRPTTRMIGPLPKDQSCAWQLISLNINRRCSSAVSVNVENLLTPVCAHAHRPVIFPVQKTRSWNVPELKLVGHVCYGCKMGLATLVVSDQFFKIKRSWSFEERCTAVLFGAFFNDRVCSGLQERFGCI